MQDIFKKIVLFTILTFGTLLFSTTAVYAMGFSVSPVLPDNQREGSGFFDLVVYPGQQQTIYMRVTNTHDTDIAVVVEAITASTTRYGDVDYTMPDGLLDITIPFLFSDIATPTYDRVYISVGETVMIPIQINVPNQSFDGIVLGAINVTRDVTQAERDAGGMIINQFASVTAVRLIQNLDTEDMPADFELGSITVELINGRVAFIIEIRNTQPLLIRDGAVATAEIFLRGRNTPIFENENNNVGFAPNSIFPYAFVDREGFGVEAGDYTARITLTYQGRTWVWEEHFIVTPEQATRINQDAVNLTGEARPADDDNGIAAANENMPLWAIIAIGVGALVFILLLVIVIFMFSEGRANKRLLKRQLQVEALMQREAKLKELMEGMNEDKEEDL